VKHILMQSVLTIIFIWIISMPAAGQGSAGTAATIEPRYIIDMPTAGLLPRGSFSIDMDFFQQGGMMMRLNAGIFHSLSFGISYGANHVIGSDKIDPNPLPGINIRLRVMDETTVTPAVMIGFDSQGKEAYIERLERFTIKSPGFFVSLSKNYSIFGHLSVHGGVNYSLENTDRSKGLNIYSGLEKSFGPEISMLLEYNLGLNDSRSDAIGRGRGYLSTGFRWSFGRGFTLGFDLKDLFKNQDRTSFGNRTVLIEYVNFF
jgi:hypothetical protein